jgi:hypothetical protein
VEVKWTVWQSVTRDARTQHPTYPMVAKRASKSRDTRSTVLADIVIGAGSGETTNCTAISRTQELTTHDMCCFARGNQAKLIVDFYESVSYC